MSVRGRIRGSALNDAKEALEAMNTRIQYAEGRIAGADEVEEALDAMASALAEFANVRMDAAPLDQILAEIGADDSLVETAAELIETLGQASYAGGVEDPRTVEHLRAKLYRGLEELIAQMEFEEEEDEEPDDA